MIDYPKAGGRIAALALLATATPVSAADTAVATGTTATNPGDEATTAGAFGSFFKLSFQGEYTDFSKGRGFRRLAGVNSVIDRGPTRITLGLARGQRDFGSSRYSAIRLSADVAHDWNDRILTRTAVSAATNRPVFARLELIQELGFKATPSTILTVGGRYARFDGGAEVEGLSAGVSQYFSGGMLSYRLTGSRLDGGGRSYGHLASFKINDPGRGYGSTQLWLSAGSSLNDENALPVTDKGRFRSIAIKRSQPLGKGLSLDLGFGRTWFDKPLGNYRGNSLKLGLSFKG